MIIGITGTIGAGKGTVVEYLQHQKGFAHYSVRDFLLEEIARRGMPPSRDSMREVGNEIRATHEPSYIVGQLYDRASQSDGPSLIESVRALGEATFLKEKGVFLLAVDADRRIRFDRVRLRGSSTDDIDFDTFVAHEEKELASTDVAGQNLIGVMQMADYRIENDGTLKELHAQVDAMLATFETDS
jgi:dephospho-CoA kinase